MPQHISAGLLFCSSFWFRALRPTLSADLCDMLLKAFTKWWRWNLSFNVKRAALMSSCTHLMFPPQQNKRKTSSSPSCRWRARRGTLKPRHTRSEMPGFRSSRARSWPVCSHVRAARTRWAPQNVTYKSVTIKLESFSELVVRIGNKQLADNVIPDCISNTHHPHLPATTRRLHTRTHRHAHFHSHN